MKPVYGLLDINNCFVSCERAFNPSLENVPVLVLSANDGCAIARSSEVKALGIKMGDPHFKIARLCEDNAVRVLSSNFALYCGMSMRLMAEIQELVPAAEQYSVDEVFIDLTGMPGDLGEYCRGIRKAIRRNLGLPNCVGTGPTKTLAKLANQLAKKSKAADSVVDLAGHPEWVEKALERTSVGDVWGIGSASAAKLSKVGVLTALDLSRLDDRTVSRLLGVSGVRTAGELRGVPFYEVETQPEPRQSCMVSRSFGNPTGDFEMIREAVIVHATAAAEKLRGESLVAGALTVFCETPRFRKDLLQKNVSAIARLMPPTSDTLRIVKAAVSALKAAWEPGPWLYGKAGVLMADLCLASNVSGDLFMQPEKKPTPLMDAMDRLNSRFARGTVTLGTTSKTSSWRPRADNLSADWISDWSQIPVAVAKPPQS